MPVTASAPGPARVVAGGRRSHSATGPRSSRNPGAGSLRAPQPTLARLRDKRDVATASSKRADNSAEEGAENSGGKVQSLVASIGMGVSLVLTGRAEAGTVQEQEEMTQMAEAGSGAPISPDVQTSPSLAEKKGGNKFVFRGLKKQAGSQASGTTPDAAKASEEVTTSVADTETPTEQSKKYDPSKPLFPNKKQFKPPSYSPSKKTAPKQTESVSPDPPPAATSGDAAPQDAAALPDAPPPDAKPPAAKRKSSGFRFKPKEKSKPPAAKPSDAASTPAASTPAAGAPALSNPAAPEEKGPDVGGDMEKLKAETEEASRKVNAAMQKASSAAGIDFGLARNAAGAASLLVAGTIAGAVSIKEGGSEFIPQPKDDDISGFKEAGQQLREERSSPAAKERIQLRLNKTRAETMASNNKQLDLEAQTTESLLREKALLEESLYAEAKLVDVMKLEVAAMDQALAAEEDFKAAVQEEASYIYSTLLSASELLRQGREVLSSGNAANMAKDFNAEVANRIELGSSFDLAEHAIADQQKRLDAINGEPMGLGDVLAEMKDQALEMMDLTQYLVAVAAERNGVSVPYPTAEPDEKLKADLQRAQGVSFQLDAQVCSLRETVSSLEAQLAAEQEAGRLAKEEVAMLKKQLAGVKTDLGSGYSAPLSGSTQDQQLGMLQSELQRTTEKLEAEQDSSRRFQAEVTSLRREVTVVREEKERANQHIEELLSRLADAQQTTERYAERLREERAARDDATAAVEKLQNVILTSRNNGQMM